MWRASTAWQCDWASGNLLRAVRCVRAAIFGDRSTPIVVSTLVGTDQAAEHFPTAGSHLQHLHAVAYAAGGQRAAVRARMKQHRRHRIDRRQPVVDATRPLRQRGRQAVNRPGAYGFFQSVQKISSLDAATARLQFRYFDLYPRALSGLAVDPHSILVAEQHLQPFVHIVNPDAAIQQSGQLLLRDTHPVVLHQQVQAIFRAIASESGLYRPPPCCLNRA